jgi:hypothetical protein
LFTEPTNNEGAVELTPEIIDTACLFVENAGKSEKDKKKTVYYNHEGQAVSPEFLLPILHRGWLNGAVSPRTGVTLCYFICTKYIYSHNVIFLQVIDAYRGDLSLKMGGDRTILPAYRANSLVDSPPRRQPKKKPLNLKDLKDQQEMSACVARCMDEYFAKDKVSNMCTPLYVLQTVWLV